MSRPVLTAVMGLDEIFQIIVPRLGALGVISTPQGGELLPVRESLIGDAGAGPNSPIAYCQIQALTMTALPKDLCANAYTSLSTHPTYECHPYARIVS